MKKLLLALLLGASPLCAQIPAAQVPLTGTAGAGGNFPLLLTGDLVLAADADHTLTYPETAAYSFSVKTAQGLSLTAPRRLIAPLIRGVYTIANATAGGQAVQIIGTTGTGVSIANGTTGVVYSDGTNYTLVGTSSLCADGALHLGTAGICGPASNAVTVNAVPVTGTQNSATGVYYGYGLYAAPPTGVTNGFPFGSPNHHVDANGHASFGLPETAVDVNMTETVMAGATTGNTLNLHNSSAASSGDLTSLMFSSERNGFYHPLGQVVFDPSNTSAQRFQINSWDTLTGSGVKTTIFDWTPQSFTVGTASGSTTVCTAANSASTPGCGTGSGGSGSGSVASFSAPQASWPAWLVPTVVNPTTAPALTVAAGAIPNSALANSSITISGTAVALGGSINPPTNYAAGASAPNGAQVNVPYSPSAVPAHITAAVASTDTSLTVDATTGWPTLGCGYLKDTQSRYEAVCWTGTDATHFTGLTRGFYGSTPLAYATANTPTIVGYAQVQSVSATSTPLYVVPMNSTGINYGMFNALATNTSAAFNQLSSYASSLGAATATRITASYGSPATSGNNFPSGPLSLTGNCYTGSASTDDTWTIQATEGTGTSASSTLAFSHAGGCGGVPRLTAPVTSLANATIAGSPLCVGADGNLSQMCGAVLPSTAAYPITQAAMSNLVGNTGTFSGGFLSGGKMLTAGASYAQYGMYAADGLGTVLHNPTFFTTAEKVGWANLWFANASPAGDLVIAVPPAGVTDTSTSGQNNQWDTLDNWKHHAAGDGWMHLGLLMAQVYKEDAAQGIALWNAHGAAYMLALSRIPRNGSTHLITVNAGDEYVPCSGFQETVRDTGDNACASVWYMAILKNLLPLVNAAGDTASAATLTTDQTNFAASIGGLIDTTSAGSYQGLFWRDGAGGQNHANHDVEASAVFCYYGLGTTAQCNTIASVFDAQYSNLVNAEGYILQSPENWTLQGTISSSGATTSSYAGNGSYQDGYWSRMFLEFNSVLATVDSAKAATQLKAFAGGVNPTTEYFSRGTSSPGGSNLNLISTAGALQASLIRPPVPLGSASSGTAGYGTPTFSLLSGASVPSSGWVVNDQQFLLLYTPPQTVGSGIVLAGITWGKAWVDSGGNAVYANCNITPRLAPSAGVPLYYTDPGNGEKTGIRIMTGTGATLTGGTTYAWAINCLGTEQ